MLKDCQGVPYPVFAKGVVSECSPIVGAVPFGSVYSLKVLLEAGSQEPAAGQFYMLHAVRSDVLLGRPISVFHSEVLSEEEGKRVELTFLILLKGKGTKELCSLDFGDLINFPLTVMAEPNFNFVISSNFFSLSSYTTCRFLK